MNKLSIAASLLLFGTEGMQVASLKNVEETGIASECRTCFDPLKSQCSQSDNQTKKPKNYYQNRVQSSQSETCDIIMANAYTSLYASSTVNVEMKTGPISALSRVDGAPTHSNVVIGQYGSEWLIQEHNFMQSKTAAGAWVSDLRAKNYFDAIKEASEKGLGDCGLKENCANREFLGVTFPQMLEVRSIRLQGLGHNFAMWHDSKYCGCDSDSDYFPDENKAFLVSWVNEFEIWYNDGQSWWSLPDKRSHWQKVQDIMGCRVGEDDQFDKLQKFETDLKDPYKISTISFRPFHATEVRVIFTKYTGTVLATKLGIEVNDPSHLICKKVEEKKCKETKKK